MATVFNLPGAILNENKGNVKQIQLKCRTNFRKNYLLTPQVNVSFQWLQNNDYQVYERNCVNLGGKNAGESLH